MRSMRARTWRNASKLLGSLEPMAAPPRWPRAESWMPVVIQHAARMARWRRKGIRTAGPPVKTNGCFDYSDRPKDTSPPEYQARGTEDPLFLRPASPLHQ